MAAASKPRVKNAPVTKKNGGSRSLAKRSSDASAPEKVQSISASEIQATVSRTDKSAAEDTPLQSPKKHRPCTAEDLLTPCSSFSESPGLTPGKAALRNSIFSLVMAAASAANVTSGVQQGHDLGSKMAAAARDLGSFDRLEVNNAHSRPRSQEDDPFDLLL